MSAVCLPSTVCLLFALLAQQARHERHRRLKVEEGGGPHRQQARDHGVRYRQLIVIGFGRERDIKLVQFTQYGFCGTGYEGLPQNFGIMQCVSL